MIKDIIDGHSHIAYENEFEIVGKNIMMPLISDIQKYNEIALKNGIKTVLFSPCTSPIITNKIKNISTIYNLWKYENNKFIYFCEVIEKGKIIQKDMIKNPYYEVNKKFSALSESSSKNRIMLFAFGINSVPCSKLNVHKLPPNIVPSASPEFKTTMPRLILLL